MDQGSEAQGALDNVPSMQPAENASGSPSMPSSWRAQYNRMPSFRREVQNHVHVVLLPRSNTFCCMMWCLIFLPPVQAARASISLLPLPRKSGQVLPFKQIWQDSKRKFCLCTFASKYVAAFNGSSGPRLERQHHVLLIKQFTAQASSLVLVCRQSRPFCP